MIAVKRQHGVCILVVLEVRAPVRGSDISNARSCDVQTAGVICTIWMQIDTVAEATIKREIRFHDMFRMVFSTIAWKLQQRVKQIKSRSRHLSANVTAVNHSVVCMHLRFPSSPEVWRHGACVPGPDGGTA